MNFPLILLLKLITFDGLCMLKDQVLDPVTVLLHSVSRASVENVHSSVHRALSAVFLSRGVLWLFTR